MNLSKSYRRLFFITICIASVLFTLRTAVRIFDFPASESMRLLSFFNLFFLLSFIFYYLTVKYVFEETRQDYELMILQKTQHIKEKEIEHIKKISFSTQRQKSIALDQLNSLLVTLDNENYNAINNQIHHMQNSLKESSPISYCDHTLLNIILHNKKMLAEDKGINVHYQILTPEKMCIPMTNLASIFFNLLDNAIEACEQSNTSSPFISLKTSFQGHMLSIHMKNSKAVITSFNKKTTKSDSYSHGFGLAIIEDIVYSHQGHITWNNLGETFESIIMLNIETELDTISH